MTEPQSGAAERLRAALDALGAAYGEAVTAIDGLADRAAYEGATELSAWLRSAADAAAEKRAEIVVGIRDADALSLAQLAERFGISRSRAHQIVGPTREKRP